MNRSLVVDRISKLGWDKSIYLGVWDKISQSVEVNGGHLTPDDFAVARHLHFEAHVLSMKSIPCWEKGSYIGNTIIFSIK